MIWTKRFSEIFRQYADEVSTVTPADVPRVFNLLLVNPGGIKGEKIAEAFHWPPKTAKVRKCVGVLRRQGFPVVANDKGYRLDWSRVDQQVESLLHRAAAMVYTAQLMMKACERRNSTQQDFLTFEVSHDSDQRQDSSG